MDYDINIGASRRRLTAIAQEIIDACNKGGTVDLTLYCQGNSSTIEEVRLNFSNDDMEDRTDLSPDTVLVDVDQD